MDPDTPPVGDEGTKGSSPTEAWEKAKASMEEMIVFNLMVTAETNKLKSAQDAAKAPRGT